MPVPNYEQFGPLKRKRKNVRKYKYSSNVYERGVDPHPPTDNVHNKEDFVMLMAFLTKQWTVFYNNLTCLVQVSQETRTALVSDIISAVNMSKMLRISFKEEEELLLSVSVD